MKYTHFKNGTHTTYKDSKGRFVSPKQVSAYVLGIAFGGWFLFAITHTALMSLLAII